MRYDAFLSYSHALDGRLAPALQRGLQRFARRWHEARALAVFRDETNLAISPHLWGAIEAALREASFFVLLASPSAAASPWVEREVAWWLANRPHESLLIVLTEGRLDWRGTVDSDALPPALMAALADEPRFLDLRWARSDTIDLSLQHNRFRDAVADLAATLHGRDKDELIGEEVRQHRRLRRLRLAVMTGLVTLTLAAGGTAYWAIQEQREAQRQQAVAERNFGTALDAADAMVSEVAATLTDLEGVSKERVAKILTDAEALFGRLAESGGESRVLLDRQAGLLLAFARAYMEMGDPRRSLQRAEEAMAKLDRAQALPGEPPSGELTARRASGLFLLGVAQQSLADTTTALGTFRAAQVLYADLVSTQPARADWLAEYAESHYYVGTTLFQQGDLAGAMQVGETGMALMRRAVALEPANLRWLRDLAVGNTTLAMGYRLQGRASEAEAALEEAVGALEILVADDPSNLDLKQSLAVAYQQLAGLDSDSGDRAGAIDRLRRSGALLAELARRDPSNMASATGYATVAQDLALLQESGGDAAGAAATYAEALAVFERALAVNPDSALLNQVAINAATALARLGGSGGAAQLAALDAGAATLRRLMARDPNSALLQFQSAALLIARAGVLASEGQAETALRGFEEGLALYAVLAQHDPTNVTYPEAILAGYEAAAAGARDLGDLGRARSYLEKALAIAEPAARRESNAESWVQAFVTIGASLASLLEETGDHEAASQLRQRRLGLLHERLLAAPRSTLLLQLASTLRVEIGWAADAAGDEAAAQASFRAALELAGRLLAVEPEKGESWHAQAVAAEALALVSGGPVEIAAYDTAISGYRAALDRLGWSPALTGPLASSLNLRALALEDQGRLDEARAGFGEAVELHAALVEGGFDRAGNLEWLARDQSGLSRVLEKSGDLVLAIAASEAAAEAFAQALESGADDREVARKLADQHDNTARLNELRGDWSAAALAYGAAEEVFDRLLLHYPEDEESRLAQTYLLRLQAINDAGREALPEARRVIDKALSISAARARPNDAGLWIEVHALLLAEDARLRWSEGDRAGAIDGFVAALEQSSRLLRLMPDNDHLHFFILQTKRWLVETLILTNQRDRAAVLLHDALQEGRALLARDFDAAGELDLLQQAQAALARQAPP